MQFPQQWRKALDLVWKILLFFLLSNIYSSQSLLCSYMEIGAGRFGCFLEMALKATSFWCIISFSYCKTFLGQVLPRAAKHVPMHLHDSLTSTEQWQHSGKELIHRLKRKYRLPRKLLWLHRLIWTSTVQRPRAFHSCCKIARLAGGVGRNRDPQHASFRPMSPADAHIRWFLDQILLFAKGITP